MNRIVQTALCALLLSTFCLSCSAQPANATKSCASIDATSAWNSVCAAYAFPQAPQGGSATFASVWPSRPTMLTFEAALAGALADTAAILHTGLPGFSGEDNFNYSLTNWPD